MKNWELRRGETVLCTMQCDELRTGRTPWLLTMRNAEGKLIATIYLSTGVVLHECPATDKSLPTPT